MSVADLFTPYFPVCVFSREHRHNMARYVETWQAQVPSCRFWDLKDPKMKLYHADDLPDFEKMVVGVPGLPDWFIEKCANEHLQPKPSEINRALALAKMEGGK